MESKSFNLWNFLFRNLSIRKKIVTSFFWLAIFSLACYIMVLWTSAGVQESSSVKVDVSGRNRMLSQKIVALSYMVADENPSISKNAKTELQKTIDLIEISLNALKDGGEVPGFTYSLEPTNDPPIISKINEVISFLEEYKRNTKILINAPTYISNQTEPEVSVAAPASGALSDEQTSPAESTGDDRTLNPRVKEALDSQRDLFVKGNLLSSCIEVTEMYVKQADENALKNKAMRKNILIILLVFNVAVIILNFVLMQMYIASPIGKISDVAEQIANGNISASITYNIKDEFGKVVHAINTLTENLRKAAVFIVEIGKGNFDAKYEVQVAEGIDEKENLSSALLSMRDRLKLVAEEDKQRNWATEGLAKFGEILRADNTDVETLASNIISNLINYLKANQGGLFVINDSNQSDVHLELISCYAFERKKFVNRRVDLGEGLVGQVWQEGEYVYITDVPNDYINITSGLGGANPRSILIVPLKVNEQILGVIEIASFNAFRPFEIEFVQKLGESIASTLATAKINERTKKLLHESQQMTEELKAQEEEMRQNMEEMTATQEELQRKEDEAQRLLEESQEQSEELRQNMEEMAAANEEMSRLQEEVSGQLKTMDTMAIVSKTDIKGNITYMNDEFLKWSKYNKDELMGKNHRILKSGHQPDSLFVELWKTISNGQVFRGEIKNKAKDGSYYWVDATIAPILDKYGKPKEYIAMRYVINKRKEQEKEIEGLMSVVNRAALVSKTDLRGYITYANDEFCRAAKYNREELLGKNHNIVRHPDMPKAAFEDLWKTISSGKVWRGQVKNKAKDGTFYWVDATIAPIIGEHGKPVEYVAVRYLITDYKKQEDELQKIKKELEQLRQKGK